MKTEENLEALDYEYKSKRLNRAFGKNCGKKPPEIPMNLEIFLSNKYTTMFSSDLRFKTSADFVSSYLLILLYRY